MPSTFSKLNQGSGATGGISAETIPQGQEAEPGQEKQPEELGSKPCPGTPEQFASGRCQSHRSGQQPAPRGTAPGSRGCRLLGGGGVGARHRRLFPLRCNSGLSRNGLCRPPTSLQVKADFSFKTDLGFVTTRQVLEGNTTSPGCPSLPEAVPQPSPPKAQTTSGKLNLVSGAV